MSKFKDEMYRILKNHTDEGLHIQVVFYTDKEYGGQYCGVFFDSESGKCYIDEDCIIVEDSNAGVTLLRMESIKCVNVKVISGDNKNETRCTG